MKKIFGLAFLLVVPLALGCNGGTIGSTDPGGTDDAGASTDPCVLTPNYSTQCWLDGANNGAAQNAVCDSSAQTTVTGTVTIPSGMLPLYNAKVYIAQAPAPDDPAAPTNLPAVDHGATCDTCDKVVPTDAVASTTTDINGKFTLSKIPLPPDGKAMYLVVRVGKWRRYVRLENSNSTNAKAAHIGHCMSTAIDPTLTRLPRNKSEGDIPRIALSTGSADALECILRNKKLGLDDSEFTTESGTGSVNLYAGNGTDQFSPALGGAKFTASVNTPTASWWDSQTNWNKYDIVMLSCEGAPNVNTKSVAARDALQTYVGLGGRVFASHWHNVWIQSAKAPLSTVASFLDPANAVTLPSPVNTDIVTNFAKGVSLKQWLTNNKALTAQGQLPVSGGKNTIVSISPTLTQPWVTYQPAPNLINQYFSFYAPVGQPAASQCGEMVFTDLHVSTSTTSGAGDSSKAGAADAFPLSCKATTLSPQEEALIFLFFDLTNCVSPIIG